MQHTCGIELHAQYSCPGFTGSSTKYLSATRRIQELGPSERHSRRRRSRKATNEQKKNPQQDHYTPQEEQAGKQKTKK